jgi:hypothetical protein
MTEFKSRLGQEFSLLHVAQTGSEAYPASYRMGNRGSFPEIELAGREADHSPPTSAEVKKGGSIYPLPPYIFIA